ncbi:OmpA family protein [Acidihalobacter prosperus]
MILRKSVPVWCVILILGLGGCSTNPYTGQKEVSHTAIGAGIGAVAGAIIGNNIGQAGRNTALAATIGAIAGGSVGYYMDQQQAALHRQLQGSGVSVTRRGNNIILNMPGNITFATNQYKIAPHFYRVLNSVAKVLVHYQKTVVNVAGFTDNTGTQAYNQKLSVKRARSVAQYLIAQGVQNARVRVAGYGESHPIASNATARGRAMNRRVTITLVPITR